ncbi:hypothetical protein F511_18752 [Dorcoceras hygrometricum]|uniref:Uncharacterized protein n=1 Tax=Dorcoceras hygrometricum TaxID=472368 RepID=A0A2Z7ACQ4_9LAMI|nr:hypothetical protein F511_18752 [Dorcoceras hygrometricum]
MEIRINSIKKATDKYAHAMQRIKATTESREPKDLNNSSTTRSDQRNNNQFVATGILSTWELPTHLQNTIPDANKQLHLLLPTHEMWELPTRLIAVKKPSREMRHGSYPLSLRGIRELPARPRSQHPGILKINRTGTVSKTESKMVFSQLPCWRLGAWLRPVSRGNRHFTVGGGRLRQSGPRPEGRLLRQPALEGLTRSARTDSPRKVGRNKFRRGRRRRRRQEL